MPIQEGWGGVWQLSSHLFGSMKSGCTYLQWDRYLSNTVFIHCFQWTMIMGERVLHSNLILFVDLSCSGDYTKIRPSVAVSLFFLVVCRTFLVVHIFFEQVHDWGYQKAIPLSVHNFTSMSCAPKGTTGFVSIIRTLPPRNKAFSGGVMNHHPYFLRFRWHWEEVIP